ncbi:MAG: TetR/AcrR family transcriptional regulator [Solirubrobacterales bacterium]
MNAELPAVAEAGPAPESSARERILDAAVERIAGEGIDDVRIARIAVDAGVSPALVHYHFDSRETLLAEALEHSYHRVGRDRIPPDEPPSSGPEQRLRRMVETYLPLPGEQRRDWMLWVELWLRAMRHPGLEPTSARLYADMHARVRDAALAAAGDRRPSDGWDPDEFADHLLALIDGLGVRVLLGDPGMSRERMRCLVWSFVSGQLALDPDPNPPDVVC